MIDLQKRIAILGAGNMGAALIGGMLKAGFAGVSQIVATVRSLERAEEVAAKYGVQTTAGGNCEAAASASLIVLAVKPPTVPKVLAEIRSVLHEQQVLVSLAGSVTISLIEKLIHKRMPVFRAMPNIPVVVEEGATAISANAFCNPEHRQVVERLFRSVGVVVTVDEDLMHAVTALSGSGPAYIYMVIEALIDGGVKMGLSREAATRLAEQTVLGSAKLVRETTLHPAILRDQVTTPGGTTIAAIHELERHGLRSMLISAIETATRTSEVRTQALLAKFGD
jgi:pyrroline-5-carboxylate reductase